MAVFYDDFQRADGSLGTGWGTPYGSPGISGGYVVGASYWTAVTTSVTDADFQDVTVKSAFITGQTQTAGPLIKGAEGGRSGYWCNFVYTGGAWYFRLYRRDASASYQLASADYPTTPPYLTTMRITYDQGDITATVDGAYTLTATDTTYALNVHMGMVSTNGHGAIADFRAVGTQQSGLSITPEIIGAFGLQWSLEALGTSTAWEAGTPGSPTFTCDHGEIDSQTVATSTTATLLYSPGEYLGPVVFTDPSTGETDTIMVTSNPAYLPEFALCPFDEGFINMANRSDTGTTPRLITDNIVVVAGEPPATDLTFLNAISDLWYMVKNGTSPGSGNSSLADQLDDVLMWISGGYLPTMATPQPPPQTTLKEDTESLTTSIDEIRTANAWTLGSVITEICGEGVPQITDVLAAIAGIEGGSNQDVLDALAAYFGANPPTIEQLGLMVEGIATVAGYNLADVLDAIAAIPAANNADVIARIDQVQPNTAYTMSTTAASLLNLATDVNALGIEVAAVKALVEEILAAIGPAEHAPVWPGMENVTLGEEVALVDQLVLDGPMDGVLIHVTTPPTRTGLRMVGAQPYDYSVGEIAFAADNGYIEPWQYMGFRTALFTPKSMVQASSALLRVLAGAGGTARTWIHS